MGCYCASTSMDFKNQDEWYLTLSPMCRWLQTCCSTLVSWCRYICIQSGTTNVAYVCHSLCSSWSAHVWRQCHRRLCSCSRTFGRLAVGVYSSTMKRLFGKLKGLLKGLLKRLLGRKVLSDARSSFQTPKSLLNDNYIEFNYIILYKVTHCQYYLSELIF